MLSRPNITWDQLGSAVQMGQILKTPGLGSIRLAAKPIIMVAQYGYQLWTALAGVPGDGRWLQVCMRESSASVHWVGTLQKAGAICLG